MKFSDYIKQKVFSEMATEGDVVRQPIRLDKDDIEFLYQFPPELWVQAIRKRYHDDLIEALDERHKARLSDREKIKELAIKAIRSRNFKQLEKYPKYFDKATIDKIRKDYNKDEKKYYQDQGSEAYESALENAGKNIAYYIVEKIHAHAAEPKDSGYKQYDFKYKRKSISIMAKPFINRLIHKLEKTKGEDHDPSVGLDSNEHKTGQYGYDLQNIFKGHGLLPGATQGMQLITKDMAEEAIKEFLKDNYQHYYGKLPEIGEEVELPDGKKTTIDQEKHVSRFGPVPFRTDDSIEGPDKRIKLPTFKKEIKLADGTTMSVDMPFVLSTKYTRHVGENQEDPNRLGKRKDRIEIPPDDYMNQSTDAGVSSGGSFTSNKNRSEERKKALGVAGARTEREAIIGSMEKYPADDDKFPNLYKDIVNGIMQAISQKIPYTAIRDWEAAIAESNIKEIHDMLLQKIENLSSKEKFKSKQKRIDYVKRMVISILGQNIHGGQTRSLRLSQMPAPEIIPTSLRTKNQQDLIDNLHTMSSELAASGRKKIAGEFSFPYTNLKTIVKILEDESAASERADHIIGASADKAPEQIKDIFSENYRRKSLLISAMKEVLEKLIFTSSAGKLKSAEAEEEANRVIADNILRKKTMSAMVAAFASLKIVQDAMREEPIATVPTKEFGITQKKSKLPTDASDPRERAESLIPWQTLQAKGDWLALMFRHDFMSKANKNTLLNLDNWLGKQKDLIPQDVYNDASSELKHYLSLVV